MFVLFLSHTSSHGSEAEDENSDDDATGDVGHKKLKQWEEKRKLPDYEEAEIIDFETGESGRGRRSLHIIR